MDQDQDVVDPSLRLSTVIPENMTPLLERPHHVTQNLVGNQIAIKWDLGCKAPFLTEYFVRLLYRIFEAVRRIFGHAEKLLAEYSV